MDIKYTNRFRWYVDVSSSGAESKPVLQQWVISSESLDCIGGYWEEIPTVYSNWNNNETGPD